MYLPVTVYFREILCITIYKSHIFFRSVRFHVSTIYLGGTDHNFIKYLTPAVKCMAKKLKNGKYKGKSHKRIELDINYIF